MVKVAAKYCIACIASMLISSVAWSDTKPIVEMVVSLKNAKTANVRAQPDPDSNTVAFVENGKTVGLSKGNEEKNGFVMVQLADGRSGWMKSAFLAPLVAVTAGAQVQQHVDPAVEPVVPHVNASDAPAAAVPEMVAPMGTPTFPAAADAPHSTSCALAPNHDDALPVPSVSPAALAELGVKASPNFWIAGLVGLLIGLLVGGKTGMVYARKAIYDKYIVID